MVKVQRCNGLGQDTYSENRTKWPSSDKRQMDGLKKCWSDDIIAAARMQWMESKNKDEWHKLGKAYTQNGGPTFH
ncbi:unnamed protein product [Pieris macdunnoughi]|uniref:Uncharacterized protein n=1 Tax=Pieris macdunnoughi TaxID=345717 RepID=A0A821SD45_9NEOP|nr:unnamed protein product [Pieris macdunnoughi]